jgi:hypothetical protein
LCRSDSDCCDSTANGGSAGVTCQLTPGYPVGYCTGPNGCRPLGDTCHLKNYACSISAAPNDCCAIPNPSNKICAIDPLGVPRCASGICANSGGQCSNSLDCCSADGGLCYDPNNPDAGPAEGCLPCIPNPDGGSGFYCAEPNDAGTFCRGQGQTCTINGDCCAGLMCDVPPGGTTGTCEPPVPPVDAGQPPPVDAGPDADLDANMPPVDAFVCSLYGQACTQTSDCCNSASVPCSFGGSTLCTPGQAGCTCQQIIH